MTHLIVVVGAQFGSEAKGHVTQQLIRRALAQKQSVLAVRVAGPNAGHSAQCDNGVMHALRQIPVSGVFSWTDSIYSHIAAGSEIDADVLLAEYQSLVDCGHKPRLSIHPEATMLTSTHRGAEFDASLVERIGSTGKGIGAARAARLMRDAQRVIDDGVFCQKLYQLGIFVEESDLQYGTVIVEGTQGYGLGLHAGFYPQCTSSDCRAIDFLAMAGISPWHPLVDIFEIWAVARVFPIRVAGNSGPLFRETSWAELGLPEELTTVTKKVRRVGLWDGALVRAAVTANGGRPRVRVALTMLDQYDPEVKGVTQVADLTDRAVSFINTVKQAARASVDLVTTGPTTAAWLV